MERYGEIGARHRMDRGRAAGQVAAGGHQPAHRDGRGLLHLSAARCRILPLRSAPRRPTPYPHGTLNPSRTPTVAASSLGNLLVDARGRLVLIDAGPDTSMNPSNQSGRLMDECRCSSTLGFALRSPPSTRGIGLLVAARPDQHGIQTSTREGALGLALEALSGSSRGDARASQRPRTNNASGVGLRRSPTHASASELPGNRYALQYFCTILRSRWQEQTS